MIGKYLKTSTDITPMKLLLVLRLDASLLFSSGNYLLTQWMTVFYNPIFQVNQKFDLFFYFPVLHLTFFYSFPTFELWLFLGTFLICFYKRDDRTFKIKKTFFRPNIYIYIYYIYIYIYIYIFIYIKYPKIWPDFS